MRRGQHSKITVASSLARVSTLREELPGWANTVIGDLRSEMHRPDERIAGYASARPIRIFCTSLVPS